MNQYELKRQTQRLIESQDKFVATMRTQFEVIESMTDHLSHFRDYLEDFREIFVAMRGLFTEVRGAMGEEVKTLNQVQESLNAVQKAFAETNVTVNENSERMDKLLAKVESYFGTTGLDYDN